MQLDPASGWCQGIPHCPSPNFNERPTGEISLLVVHNISLPPAQFATGKVQEFFQNRLDVTEHPYFEGIADLRVSAHFLIERDGDVTQFVSCNDRAWRAGVSCFEGRETCNDFSVGIELEGTDDLPFTDAQYASADRPEPPVAQGLPEHHRAAYLWPQRYCSGRKTDPGPAFDWTRFRSALQDGGHAR